MKASTDSTVDFKTAFAALVGETCDEAHPTDDELVAYHAGELPAERRGPVEEHLLTCRECFALVRDLRSFSDAESSAPETAADFETAAFYRTLQPRLQRPLGGIEGGRLQRPLGGIEGGRLQRPLGGIEGGHLQRRWNVLGALAAAFGAAALGLTLWAASQQRTMSAQEETIARLSGIQPSVAVHLRSDQRDGTLEGTEVPSGLGATLILTLAEVPPPEAPAYEIRILDAAGSVAGTLTDLEADPLDGTVTFYLPAGALPAGSYQVVLYAGAEPIERRDLRIGE